MIKTFENEIFRPPSSPTSFNEITFVSLGESSRNPFEAVTLSVIDRGDPS